MALSKSNKSGSNVTNLADARKKRPISASPEQHRQGQLIDPLTDIPASQATENQATVNAPTDTSEATAEKPKKKASGPAKVSNRRFDTVKVERIKDEIARGAYQINYLQVADKFIEHERYS